MLNDISNLVRLLVKLCSLWTSSCQRCHGGQSSCVSIGRGVSCVSLWICLLVGAFPVYPYTYVDL